MNTSSRFTNTRNIIIFATLCTLLWGSAFPGVKIGYKLFDIASGDIASYILFAGIRFFIAGLITLLLCRCLRLDDNLLTIDSIKHIYLSKSFIIKCIQVSFFVTFFQYICFYIGLAYASSINGSIINSSGTIFTVLLAFIIYKTDRPNSSKLLGCLLSFIGIIIITFRDATSIQDVALTGFKAKGEGLLLIASLSFAVGTIISKQVSFTYNPATLTGCQLTIGGLCLTIVGAILGGSLTVTSYKALLLLGYLAILSAIAFTIWTILLKYNKASKIAIFNFLTPVFGVILSGIFLREDILNPAVGVSLLLTCVGIIIMQK